MSIAFGKMELIRGSGWASSEDYIEIQLDYGLKVQEIHTIYYSSCWLLMQFLL